MVRLESELARAELARAEHFNSLMVRLEFDLFNQYYNGTTFQFLNGAIGVLVFSTSAKMLKIFQFLNGAIGVKIFYKFKINFSISIP